MSFQLEVIFTFLFSLLASREWARLCSPSHESLHPYISQSKKNVFVSKIFLFFSSAFVRFLKLVPLPPFFPIVGPGGVYFLQRRHWAKQIHRFYHIFKIKPPPTATTHSLCLSTSTSYRSSSARIYLYTLPLPMAEVSDEGRKRGSKLRARQCLPFEVGIKNLN